MCREKKEKPASKVKLQKNRFKAFMKERYKMNDKEFPKVGIAHKVAELFDWSTGSQSLDTYSTFLNECMNE